LFLGLAVLKDGAVKVGLVNKGKELFTTWRKGLGTTNPLCIESRKRVPLI
jgi:hypothetical protein